MAKDLNFRSQEEPYVQDPPTSNPYSMMRDLLQYQQRHPVNAIEIAEMRAIRRALRRSQSQGDKSSRNLSFIDDLPSTGSANDSNLNNSVSPEDVDQTYKQNQEDKRENIPQSLDDTLAYKSLSPKEVRGIVKDELTKFLRSPDVKNIIGRTINEANTGEREKTDNDAQINPPVDEPPARSDDLSETPLLNFTYNSPLRPDTQGSTQGKDTEGQFAHDSTASSIPRKKAKIQCRRSLLETNNSLATNPPLKIQKDDKEDKETPVVSTKATGTIPKNKSQGSTSVSTATNGQQVDLLSAQKSKIDGIKFLNSLRLKKGYEEQFHALKLKYKDIPSEAWELLEAMLKRPPNVTAMPKIPIKKEIQGIPAEKETRHMPNILSKNQRKKAERKAIAENTSANVSTSSSTESSVVFVPQKPTEVIQISDDDSDKLFD